MKIALWQAIFSSVPVQQQIEDMMPKPSSECSRILEGLCLINLSWWIDSKSTVVDYRSSLGIENDPHANDTIIIQIAECNVVTIDMCMYNSDQ